MSLPLNPTSADIDTFVETSTEEVLRAKLKSIRDEENGRGGDLHPSDEDLKKKIEEKLKNIGGRRRSSKSSKKRPTAHRRRSSKYRQSCKSRTTRRKY